MAGAHTSRRGHVLGTVRPATVEHGLQEVRARALLEHGVLQARLHGFHGLVALVGPAHIAHAARHTQRA